ncbi:hypothetical protein SDC9_203367 [bioreactor metagenome]|uniref:HTH gntR-type domain-containing protein n=1 Tax=bioreactor metagenome TaxID=1076179 RepID=A0A645J873_9ZZZZ
MVTGAIQTGEKLPSVRALAGTLAINPNTIQRAYEALEREGYLYTVAGKGSFAAGRGGGNQARRETLLGQFDEAATELQFLGMTAEELFSLYQAKNQENFDRQYGRSQKQGYEIGGETNG